MLVFLYSSSIGWQKLHFDLHFILLSDVDECDPNPCQNGGICTDGINSFTCSCEDGYSGDTCDININECDSNPCQNGGICTDGIDSFTCSCEEGFTGMQCEIRKLVYNYSKI